MVCPHCGKLITSERRRRGQSNLLHKLVRAYSNASGIPFDIAKSRLKYEYGEWMEAPLDRRELAHFIAHPPYPGDFLEVGRGRMHEGEVVPVIVFLKSEAAYTKDEETEFIEFVIAQCIAADADLSFMESP
jgi:hypothetical protein